MKFSYQSLSSTQQRQVQALFDKVRLGFVNELAPLLASLNELPKDEIRDLRGLSVLAEAVTHGRLEVVRFLLENGFNADSFTRPRATMGRPCLFEARSVDMLRLLVAHGANVNAKDLSIGGDTLLMHYAGTNQPHLASAVMSMGADVNATNGSGQTAGHTAAQYFRLSMLKQLIEHGADLNVVDQWGYTPLLYAVEGVGRTQFMKDGTEVVQLLVSQPGVDLAQKTTAGKSLLQLAKRNDEIKRILRAAKISTRLEGAMSNVEPASPGSSSGFTL